MATVEIREPLSVTKVSAVPVLRIQPIRGWSSLGLRELWDYRELLYFLTWRAIKVRYKQTVLGASWAILQPLLTMAVFSLFFGTLAKMPSDGVPYPIFAYTALVPWTFFVYSLTQSSNSVVQSSNLIRKVYFPRLAIPITSVLSGAVDFILAFLVLLLLMPIYQCAPSWNVVWLPLFFLMALACALGVGLWLSALNVQFRDVRYMVPFLSQFWMFATPIAYPSSLLSELMVSGITAPAATSPESLFSRVSITSRGFFQPGGKTAPKESLAAQRPAIRRAGTKKSGLANQGSASGDLSLEEM